MNRGFLSRPRVQVCELKTRPPVMGRILDLLETQTIHIKRQILKPDIPVSA